ncbi:hypothetical protein I6H07_06230 [Hafnia alvei]|nr:hypothetical protein [Hafnia alvei]MBI0275432.1 hypothetical protein [Hafnia alvei]PNK98575.1 hypothetical protein CEQ28_013765 [Hafnia alvei]
MNKYAISLNDIPTETISLHVLDSVSVKDAVTQALVDSGTLVNWEDKEEFEDVLEKIRNIESVEDELEEVENILGRYDYSVLIKKI